jgi:oxygen-dependent protoporphyrinogen oxidase
VSSASITVIGAGLSGLATAWYLSEAGAEVRVVEAGSGVGGLINTTHAPEGLIETAARAFTWTERTADLFNSLGLEPCYARDESRRRYIFRGGRPRRWPLGPFETAGAAARFARAWAGRTIRPQAQETVSDWGARVVGRAATTWLIAPALQGIYASPPSDLSAAALFGRKRARRGKLMAPAKGMGDLMTRLHERLQSRGVIFEFNRTVTPADLDPSQRFVICTGAPAAARLLAQQAPALSRALEQIRMVSIAIATAFFEPRPDDVRGFGVLFPRSAGVRALGVLFNAEIFEGRSDLRSETWIYGDRDVSSLPANEGETTAAVIADRRVLTGRSAAPHAMYVTAHRDVLPIYNTAVLDAHAALPNLPAHLAITGNYFGRLGVSALIDGAAEVATRFGGDRNRPEQPAAARGSELSGATSGDAVHRVPGTALPRA